ncbi:hypothetical protein PM022_16605 [Halorubrum ezzemoulense]|nr:hypothetical protein [Halorubrum ezzemoulense]MDB2276130.1 hypothetical protein [Halorubrum ezzemoulense]
MRFSVDRDPIGFSTIPATCPVSPAEHADHRRDYRRDRPSSEHDVNL